MKEAILQSVNDAIRAISILKEAKSIAFMEQVADVLTLCFQREKKLLIAGNGGSLCDAMHFAEELTGQFREKRPALAAIALADPGHMSCVANDMGYESVFARSVEALGQSDDVFVVLSTSGNSINLLRAVQKAKEKGLKTVAFLGKSGGKIKGLCDLEWVIEGFAYSDRIQEAHMAAIHIIIEMVEAQLFAESIVK